jgi:hypothetical protein
MTIFIEDFKRNKNDWTVESDENTRIFIKNGIHIDNKSESERALVTSGLRFNFTVPYHISTEIDCYTYANSEIYYGIVWDMENWENYLKAALFTNGWCGFGRMHRGDMETLVHVHSATGFNKGEASNRFDIVEGLDKIRGFVNYHVAFSSPRDIPHSGNSIGFIIGPGMKMRVKNLSFDYDNSRITTFLKSHPLFRPRQTPPGQMSLNEYHREIDSALDLARELKDPLDEDKTYRGDGEIW